ncbi:hypothetical protein CTEN210_10379 [Chaetoceros tenuissimus]|uniref:Uncharacterized protein n=1 Tax=Chaetoceros tenuissimus TaxID=426638 RepID=A0AAD3CXA8_9STRA|nr:hypothetical protein CTEN210_10379 [Chaetoceros tenuissimus]
MKIRKMKKRKMKKIELILLGMLLLLLTTIILNISIALDLKIVSTNIIKAPDKDNMSINNQRQQAFSRAHFDLLQKQRLYDYSSSSSNHTESKEHDMKSMVSRNVSKPTPKLLRQAVGLAPKIQCHSPEKNVPWILDGTCMKDPHRSIFSSASYKRTCGLCGNGAEYLRELQEDIAKKFASKCKELVVYGAALGSKYEQWMRSSNFLGDHSIKVVRRHGTCFFQFVTDVDHTGDLLSADGSQRLIVIDPSRMPYKNNRRNTKILKLNPGLLFPWADRVIWQDAKLLQSNHGNMPSPRGLPSDYLLHFNRTVGRYGVCSSYMGLPPDKASVGDSSTVSFKAHCDAIIASAEKRPTVSDDLETLRLQCQHYEGLHSNEALQSSQLFYNQHPLVDTAFIVYDMRNSTCRKFNGDFGCSWLSEIHCFSDRDQISFPHVLASSGLRLSPHMQVSGQEYRDRIYINEKQRPMLHIAKRGCHWYYRSFSRCVASSNTHIDEEMIKDNETPPTTTTTSTKPRVAVIVAGTLNRFIFDSALKNLIKPMKKRASVDYYVSLSTARMKAYRSDSGYTDRLQPDPTLPSSTVEDFVDIEEYIRTKIASLASSVGAVYLQESIDIDSEPMLIARRERALQEHPDEDPDSRFPIIDNRNAAISQRTANANRNLLRLHLAIQSLWKTATNWEKEEGFKYDYVMFLRDDSLWLKEFDIRNLLSKGGDIFIPACDARDPPLQPSEINDHILVSRRDTADVFGNYYSELSKRDVKGCMKLLPDDLTKGGKRGCNSEMLLKWIVDERNITVTKLGQSKIPFQRSANVKLPDGSNVPCFHKFCQSRKHPLTFTNESNAIKICKQIDWKKVFEIK